MPYCSFLCTLFIEIDSYNPNFLDIREVAEILRQNGIAIIPTDSVYALVGSLESKEAMLKLCKLADKKPAQANLSILLSEINEVSKFTTPISTQVFRMMKQYLPGAFTFILRANSSIPKLFLNNRKTVGVRIPDNAICRALLKELNAPLVSTSLKNNDEILEYFSDAQEIDKIWSSQVDVIVDGGPSIMEPSTIIDCTEIEPIVVREGAGKL